MKDSGWKGLFNPKNPSKYKGDLTKIVYRSRWELMYMGKLDLDENVISWGSETIVVPYRSPLDNRIHRYFVDFIVTTINKEGVKKTTLIEIKPYSQTMEPKRPNSKMTRKFITEAKAWSVNKAKWEACKVFCEPRGWDFQILTERELGIVY